jgi:type IV secretory pathway TrbL component
LGPEPQAGLVGVTKFLTSAFMKLGVGVGLLVPGTTSAVSPARLMATVNVDNPTSRIEPSIARMAVTIAMAARRIGKSFPANTTRGHMTSHI